MARSAILSLCLVVASALQQHAMQKRQIFREQVLPQSGGKIPDEAFRTDRLALNRLNKEGIAIPDGVLLETRHRESHFPSHRHDPDINASIIRLVQRPDGRYAPPEGRYPFNELVESTYVIRPPINVHGYKGLPPRKPIPATLQLPASPFFSQAEEFLNINNLDNSDLLDTISHDFPGTRLWTGFGPLFHETANRILRHSGKVNKDQTSPTANQLPGSLGGTKSLNLSPFNMRPSSFHGLGSYSKPSGGRNILPGIKGVTEQKPSLILTNQVLQKPPNQLNPHIIRTAVQPLQHMFTHTSSTPQPTPLQRFAISYRPQEQTSRTTSKPTTDYPNLSNVPITAFACRGQVRSMEPDPSTNCQVFHLCHPNGRKDSFLCPAGTRYDKKSNLCNPWRTVSC